MASKGTIESHRSLNYVFISNRTYTDVKQTEDIFQWLNRVHHVDVFLNTQEVQCTKWRQEGRQLTNDLFRESLECPGGQLTSRPTGDQNGQHFSSIHSNDMLRFHRNPLDVVCYYESCSCNPKSIQILYMCPCKDHTQMKRHTFLYAIYFCQSCSCDYKSIKILYVSVQRSCSNEKAHIFTCCLFCKNCSCDYKSI